MSTTFLLLEEIPKSRVLGTTCLELASLNAQLLQNFRELEDPKTKENVKHMILHPAGREPTFFYKPKSEAKKNEM